MIVRTLSTAGELGGLVAETEEWKLPESEEEEEGIGVSSSAVVGGEARSSDLSAEGVSGGEEETVVEGEGNESLI